jgi:5-methyltetrahydropteroyltriglutamate--homocysteine methyltransferase
MRTALLAAGAAAIVRRAAMRILCANHSSYPAPGPDISAEAGLAAALRDQEAAGLDLITDGQLTWGDPVTPMLAPLDGVRLGPPQALPGGLGEAAEPIVQGKLRRHRPLCVAAYTAAAQRALKPVKVVLTGPYTLAHAARIATTAYRGPSELARDLATLLAQEVAALVAAGAPVIQIDEPLILQRPLDARLLRELLEPLYDAAGGAAQIMVSTYGGDATALYAQLNSLPADVIALDCADRPALCDLIAESGSGKPLALGLVDYSSGSPAASDIARLARLVERCVRRYAHDTIMLQPARGLRGAPVATARAALALLCDVRDSVASPCTSTLGPG